MTLFEIIDAVKSGQRPTYDDLRYAVAALDGLSTFDHMALSKLAEAEREGKKPFLNRSAVFQNEERFKRWKLALGRTPREWLGPEYDPDNPEYQKHRTVALKLLDKAMVRDAAEGKGGE